MMNRKTIKFTNIISQLVLLAAYILAWYWFTWRLALVLFLVIFYFNLQKQINETKNCITYKAREWAAHFKR